MFENSHKSLKQKQLICINFGTVALLFVPNTES